MQPRTAITIYNKPPSVIRPPGLYWFDRSPTREPRREELDEMLPNSVIGYCRKNGWGPLSHYLDFKLENERHCIVSVEKKYVMPVEKQLEAGREELESYLHMLLHHQKIKLMNVKYGESALPLKLNKDDNEFHLADCRDELEDLEQDYLRHQKLNPALLQNAIDVIEDKIQDNLQIFGYRGYGDLDHADKEFKRSYCGSVLEYMAVNLTIKARLEYLAEDVTRADAFRVSIKSAPQGYGGSNETKYSDQAAYAAACKAIKERIPNVWRFVEDGLEEGYRKEKKAHAAFRQ